MNQQTSARDEDQQELIELYPATEHKNMRLDKFVSDELPDLSRTYLQQLISDGALLVDGFTRRPSFKVTPGQVITLDLPRLRKPRSSRKIFRSISCLRTKTSSW